MTLGQDANEGVCREHLARCGVHVELGTGLAALQQDADGVNITVKKVDEAGLETIETIRADYVVGADGGKGVLGLLTVGVSRWLTAYRRDAPSHRGHARGGSERW